MKYERVYIAEEQIPRAGGRAFQHAVDTDASETNQTASVWQESKEGDLAWLPHPSSSKVAEILRYQLLSERLFFGEF
jgi:hypothetical protein